MLVAFVITRDEDGRYVAVAPNLPGCHTQGDSIDEALSRLTDAARLYLSSLKREKLREILSEEIVMVGLLEVGAID